MIVGIGNDIVDMGRMADIYHRQPRMAKKILTPDENREFADRKFSIEYLSGRFAAKEAIYKAMNVGDEVALTWQKVSILGVNGAPVFHFNDEIQNYMHDKNIKKCHLSITHDAGIAAAMVIIES